MTATTGGSTIRTSAKIRIPHVLLNMRGGIQSHADRLLETPIRLPESSAIHSTTSQPNAQINAPSIDPDPNDRD
ncbi:MAG: hypothetical protein DRI90_20480 [Deltaproteobacteria bacterium]|nr:MAG: hypothetical protein DRI90_20480 [Deltaproteobacteria bacterium]